MTILLMIPCSFDFRNPFNCLNYSRKQRDGYLFLISDEMGMGLGILKWKWEWDFGNGIGMGMGFEIGNRLGMGWDWE